MHACFGRDTHLLSIAIDTTVRPNARMVATVKVEDFKCRQLVSTGIRHVLIVPHDHLLQVRADGEHVVGQRRVAEQTQRAQLRAMAQACAAQRGARRAESMRLRVWANMLQYFRGAPRRPASLRSRCSRNQPHHS